MVLGMNKFSIETEQEKDGRWIAEVLELAGALCYGKTREEAIARVEALSLRILADRLETEGAAIPFGGVAFSPTA